MNKKIYKLSFGVYDVSPVEVPAFYAHNENFRRGNVCCQRDIMYIAKAHNRCYLRLVRLLCKRVSEKENRVYFVIGKSRPYLLIAALRTREKFINIQTRRFFNKITRCGGCTSIFLCMQCRTES